MHTFYLFASAPALVGLVVAIIAWIASRPEHVRPTVGVRVVALVASLSMLAVMLLFQVWSAAPFWVPFPFTEDSLLIKRLIDFALPLVLALVMVLALAWPTRRPITRGTADLAPRTVATFTRPRWLGGLAAVTAVTVTAAVTAGFASQPDEAGRYVEYWVEVARETAVGTTIYGWYFSLPCLLLVLVLLLATIAVLRSISQPSLGLDRELEGLRRRHRARNVLAAASGGMLLHLAAVLGSLGGTAALGGRFSAGTLGSVTVGTPFAALGPALTGAGFIAACLGFALWWFVPLTVLTLRRRTSSPEPE